MKEKPDSTREAAKASKPFRTRTHDGFMVRFVYLPIHEWLIFMVNIGNYTIVPWHGWYGLEIDSLGTTPFFFFNFLLTNQKKEKKNTPKETRGFRDFRAFPTFEKSFSFPPSFSHGAANQNRDAKKIEHFKVWDMIKI